MKYLSDRYVKVFSYKGYDICTLKVAVPSEQESLNYRVDDESFKDKQFSFVEDAVKAIKSKN